MFKQKIALIGNNSFIGKGLFKGLENTFDIVGYGRTANIEFSKNILFNYPNTQLDLASLINYDIVIYCAGAGVQSKNNNEFTYPINTFQPIEIALSLNNSGFTGKFITFGSYFEIGSNSEDREFNESEVANSNAKLPNDYCLSKRLLTRFFSDVDLRINYYHLILPTIYGKGENEMRILPYLVRSISQNLIPKLTSGNQVRQYLHIDDLANLIKNLVQAEDIKSGIYNIPANETVKIKKIAQFVCDAFQFDFQRLDFSNSRYDESMKYLALDSNHIKSLLPNWAPSFTIKKSIKNYL